MFTQSYYLQRAAELEALAAQASDSAVRTSYLELAEGFRDIANLTGVPQMQSDEEAVRLAERMVGNGQCTPRGACGWENGPHSVVVR
jgi:hypothetical protein